MALNVQFKNNASGTLSAPISNVDVSIVLTAGHGARFPSLAGSQYFYATLKDGSNNLEVVKVTARSTDTLTVVRAQEGTSGTAYTTNDVLELRPTAAGLEAIYSEATAAAVATALTNSQAMALALG